MPDTSIEVIRDSLQEAATAAASLASQLRAFSKEGDDEEVQSMFALHADKTGTQHGRLAGRLEQLGGSAVGENGGSGSLAPEPAQSAHLPEEHIARNLIAAFSLEHGALARYEALAAIAHAAGDTTTETLGREIQAEEKETAEIIWRLIPSRVKIAFNMLTVGELDPSIETRAADNRIYS